jgi:hypothetical protein
MASTILAIILAAAANMMIGMVWYSPLLFGNTWMKLMGLTIERIKQQSAQMNKTYMISFVGAIFEAAILRLLIGYLPFTDVFRGMLLGFWLWLGMIAPVQLTEVLFGNKPVKLFFLNTGYQLVAILVMGGIIAALT